MGSGTDVAVELYTAFKAWDADRLRRVLSDDFVGQVTSGLPEELGGRYEGAEAMLTQVWGRVAGLFLGMHPAPEEYLEVEGDRILVLGRYVGQARRSGRPLDAEFAHLLEVTDGRISSLRQFTDSQRWVEALS